MLNELWTTWTRQVNDFVSPPICPLCRHSLKSEEDEICAECRETLPLLPQQRCPGCGGANSSPFPFCEDCLKAPKVRPWKLAVTAFPYHDVVREAILQFKFHRGIALAPFFGKEMARCWLEFSDRENQPDFVTYIPLFLTRYLRRGYNQAALLAEQVGKMIQCPLITALFRCRPTGQQAMLSAQQRQYNMQYAFLPWNKKRWQNRHLLLIDDVFTTGSTLTSAARTLLDCGAREVSVLTLARD